MIFAILMFAVGLTFFYICIGGLVSCLLEDYYNTFYTGITQFLIWPFRLCIVALKCCINIWPLSKKLFAYLCQLPSEVKEIITEDWNA